MPSALENPLILWLLLSSVVGALAYFYIREELRIRAVLFSTLLIGCLVAMWPPYDMDGKPGKIRLGLDLRGGVHVVMQVQTEQALSTTVDDRVQRVRDDLTSKGIVFAAVERKGPTSYAVEGVEPARVKDAHDILVNYARPSAEDPGGWDLRAGDARFDVTMSGPLQAHLKDQTVSEVLQTLERRVNVLGVAEPIIAKHGKNGDQVLIQLPGVTNPDEARRVIQTTAQLALKLVEKSDIARDALLRDLNNKVPDSMDLVPGQGEEAGRPTFYLVQKEAIITGRDLKTARVGVDQFNQPAVHFSLKPYGASKFKDFTGKSIGRNLAIILDGNVVSAPRIESKISDEGQITGRFTMQEAEELSKVLRAGALPATLTPLQELTVGASLGRDSIRSGIMASVAGMSFIALFMLVYYRLSGVNAIVALAANLLILMGTMAYTAATLTLPGVAGVILTIGIGVDTNVLVFERIREELRNGKTVKAAIANGFDRVWIVILDTHATALIAAAFLFQFGTGPIKGFAVTLVVGLIANVVASYFVSKFLFEWILGKRQVATLSI